MQTVGDLKQAADTKLFAGDYPGALTLYCAVLQIQPLNLDARLRVADALLALGEVQGAAVVYTSLAQHTSQAGYPLRSLSAIKILTSLEPQLGQLLGSVAKLYARDSPRLGRGARQAPPSPKDPLPAGFDPETLNNVDAATAQAIGAKYEASYVHYPDKLMPIPVLSLLEAKEFAGVLSAIKLVRAKPGTSIIAQGSEGSSFFVLTRGAVNVERKNGDGSSQHLAQLHEGAIFGEMALLTASPRTAEVIAVQDCDLLEFDRNLLNSASDTVASLTGALGEFAQERLLSNLMSTAEVFRPLDQKQRLDLVRRFVAVEAEPGAVFIQEGDWGRGLYAVLRGEVVVTKQDDGHTAELARLTPGDMFGEISLLSADKTTATVTASTKTTVLFLGREYFERLVEAFPVIRTYLEQISEDRLMDTRISMTPPEPQETIQAGDSEDAIEIDILI